MKIQFQSNLEYQRVAIDSVTSLFKGQLHSIGEYSQKISDANEGKLDLYSVMTKNELSISKEQLLKNLQLIQKENKLEVDKELGSLDFSIEMETGTGKTYVYLKTIYELHKIYGFKKFIIVVPSVAIREGVLATLKLTVEHFEHLYDRTPIKTFVYDSGKLGNVRNFASNDQLQVMIINIDSFNKEGNIFNRYDDKIQGRTKDFVNSANPIVIIDEPQNMESEKSKESLRALNPLFTLRYSATHKNLYHPIYRLGPVEAYNNGLVKQIEVLSVVADGDYSGVYIKFIETKATKTKITAKLEIYKRSGSDIKKSKLSVSAGDNLYDKSGKLGSYDGFIVSSIESNSVYFENGAYVSSEAGLGGYNKEIMKRQIKDAISEHFKKEAKLKAHGIKPLTLFFIDKVDNYFPLDGWMRETFVEYYMDYTQNGPHRNLCEGLDIQKIHNGYFAKTSKGEAKDTKGDSKDDIGAYQLIMQDKELLLDPKTHLRFIFSHSALKEGWDNPNVFTICTLNETNSTIKKRQEIGRGLRICINNKGERVYDKDLNRLTLIANERYESYARDLQTEYAEDGVKIERPKNSKERKTVRLKKGYKLDENFKELWEKIKHKTKYAVRFTNQELIDNTSVAINQLPYLATEGQITSNKVLIEMGIEEGVSTKLIGIGVSETLKQTKVYVPDIITHLQNETSLTRETIVEILKKVDCIDDVFKNPEKFILNITGMIKATLGRLLVNNIEYTKCEDYYEMSLFKDEYDAYVDKLFEISNQDKTLYDHIEFDSSVEEEFAKVMEARDDILFYVKLPNWFKIPTPVGEHNPDWAVVKKNGEKVFMIKETKSSCDLSLLRPSEKDKIRCGKKWSKSLESVSYDCAVDGQRDV
jgi:type III restriction enzyme